MVDLLLNLGITGAVVLAILFLLAQVMPEAIKKFFRV